MGRTRTSTAWPALAVATLVAATLSGLTAAPASAVAPLGRTVTSFLPPAGSTGEAVLVMGDGRRVLGGGAGGDFALRRFTGSETPDLTFSADGDVTTDFGGRVDVVRALARGAGNVLVAAGSSSGDVAMARYDAYGDLDPTFGTAGRVVTDLGGPDDSAYGVVVQASGKVVVVGGNGSATVVLRYLVDGMADAGFGSSGRVVLPWGRPARAILAQPDGALVVIGSGGSSIDVARIDADGALDPTFGTGGSVRLATGAGTSANGATLLWDGRIVVVGGRGGNVLMARLLPTGQVDPTFGIAGIATSDLGGTETANGVAMADDGRMWVVGEVAGGAGFAATYLPGGALEVRAGNPLAKPPLRAIVNQFDKLATVGTSAGLMYSDFGFGFPTGTTRDFRDTVEAATAAVRQADGKMVAVGDTSGIIGLARFTADGALDPSFGAGGKVVSDKAWFPRAVLVQPGGRIVVAGMHRDSAALVGFRPDGSLDPTFGTAGRVLVDAGDESPTGLQSLPDGKLLLGGGERTGAFLARFSTDGVPDPTFGDQGLLRGAFPGYAGPTLRMVRQPDGKTLATGVGNSVSRFNVDGTPDLGFGQGGTVRIDPADMSIYRTPTSLVLQADGRIVVGGTAPLTTGPFKFAVLRLNPDGSRDASWPTAHVDFPLGVSASSDGEVRQLFLQSDGRVVAIGDGVAARFRTDGRLDASFGTDGRARLQHPSTSVVDGFLETDGRLTSVGSTSLGVHARGFLVTVNRLPEPGRFHALTPARILDTRVGNGATTGKVGPGAILRLQVSGRGGVPVAGVSAVVMNLTVTEASEGTYLTAWPAGAVRPLASNLNVAAGQTLPNLVTVAIGDGGVVNVFNNQGAVHVIADVAGWYGNGTETGGAGYHPVSPARLLDTRDGNGPLGAGGALDLQVTGRGGVPGSGVSAVVLNLTAVAPTAGTFVTAWPAGQPRPLASNLNVVAGQTAPNLVVVAVGAGGRVSLFNQGGAVHLVADVAGWFGDGAATGGARFHAFSPVRLLDTRFGDGAPASPIGPVAPLDLQVTGRAGVPAVDVTAVVLNVTVTQPTAGSHLTVWPAGQTRPLASNLNFVAGQTVANLVTVGVGAGGRISIYGASGLTHVVVDIAGWYGE